MSFLDKIPDETIKHLLTSGGDTVENQLKSIRDERNSQDNEFAENKSGSMRHEVSLPPKVYWYLTFKYGKQIWKNKKFMRELWDTWKVFRIAERY